MSGDLFVNGACYPSRGWLQRALRFGVQRGDGGATSRQCPRCNGLGIYFDELQEGDDMRRAIICRECPAFQQWRNGERP